MYFMHILEIETTSDLMNFDVEDFLEDTIEAMQRNVDDLLLEDIERYDEEKTRQSSKDGHPEWFMPLNDEHGGFHERYQSKEDYFNQNFERRIRKFYKKKRSPSEERHGRQPGLLEKLLNNFSRSPRPYLIKVEEVIIEFNEILKSERDSRKYFDRRSSVKMCTDLGEYKCINYLDQECGWHSINPYRSRDERLLFRSWELDHM